MILLHRYLVAKLRPQRGGVRGCIQTADEKKQLQPPRGLSRSGRGTVSRQIDLAVYSLLFNLTVTNWLMVCRPDTPRL